MLAKPNECTISCVEGKGAIAFAVKSNLCRREIGLPLQIPLQRFKYKEEDRNKNNILNVLWFLSLMPV